MLQILITGKAMKVNFANFIVKGEFFFKEIYK